MASVPECPYKRAADIDAVRGLPRVVSWALLRDGRISVTRTDVPNHIEEWDAYAVIAPFSFGDVLFVPGELVTYRRRDKGNEFGAASEFQHLQRLP